MKGQILSFFAEAATSIGGLTLGPYTERVLWAAGGSFLSLVVAYVGIVRDVSYIRGKVDLFEDQEDRIKSLANQHGELRSDIRKLKRQIGGSNHG